MSADLIARCVILAITVIVATVELYFVLNASIAKAEILERVEHVRDSTSQVTPKTNDVISARRFRVRLEPHQSDGRIGWVSVKETTFEAASIGDKIDVMCLAHKPAWIFWTTLVRDQSRVGKWNHFFLALGFVAAAGVFVGWYFFL